MSEKWIVAIKMAYYPEVEEFDDEMAARANFDEQVRIYGDSATIYLARVTNQAGCAP